MGSGRPLDETTRSQMESIVGHDLKEVRIHDSRQAGELASRLGAEAFTVGANMFAGPGRLTTGTSEGAGLLGHEATHVVQQTRPRELAVDEPRRPLVPAATGRARKAPSGPSNEGGNGKAVSSDGAGRSLAGGSVQRQGHSMTGEGGDEAVEEVEAQAFEQVARDTVQRAEDDEEDEVGSEVDVEKLADSLFRLMRRELLLERERRW